MKRTLSAFIAIICACAFSLNVCAAEYLYVDCNVLNVRVSPNTECEIVDKLPRGEKLEIIYADNGWYNIRMSNGVTGFVNKHYVKKAQSSVGASVAAVAVQYVGCAYSYGASGPGAFDCSGLTSYVYKQHGVSLPRTSTSQGNIGVYVEKENLAMGDLVFFSNRSDRVINHVGIYIGDNRFVHAATTARGVVTDNITSSYYVDHYVTARRVI